MTFRPGQSLVHRLHPVVKLAWLLWVTVAVFAFDSVALPLVGVACVVALLWLSGVTPWNIPAKRLLLTLGLLVLAVHLVAVHSGDLLVGPVTTGGLAAGLRAVGRLWAVILASTLFVTTTEPLALAHGLIRVGVPYRWGFALVTALRLAPLFRLEAHHVYRAQLVRGVAYDVAGPRRWWLMLRNLFLPLLVSALRSAHWLSLSMEGRAFGLHARRTYVREVTAGWRDAVAGVVLAFSIGAAIWHGTR